jgi:pyruvate,water dikinase
MFTVDLVTGDDSTITIEGAWGLGEYVVQGTVTPDNFKVRKDDLTILSKMINTKPDRTGPQGQAMCEEKLVPGTAETAGHYGRTGQRTGTIRQSY